MRGAQPCWNFRRRPFSLARWLLAGGAHLTADGEPVTVEQELPDNQALLPVAAVFFLPKSSTLSPLALDIVAQTARRADSGSIVIIRASHDHEAGEQVRQRSSEVIRCVMNWSARVLPTRRSGF